MMFKKVVTFALTLLVLLPSASWAQDSSGLVSNLVKELEVEEGPEFDIFNHGFRLGYMHVVNHDCKEFKGAGSCEDFDATRGMRTPHLFLIGYEMSQRLRGNGWLNVLFVENITIGGLEQSLFLPSLNFMLGLEFANQVQLAFGINLLPIENKPAHMAIAVGWTPRVGSFYTPIHFLFVPDVDNQHRFGVTVGVNW